MHASFPPPTMLGAFHCLRTESVNGLYTAEGGPRRPLEQAELATAE
jgi:hypothetical protein